MLFAAIAAALAFLRRKVDWGTGWVWPVPNLRTADGKLYEAVISDGVGSPRPGGALHRGVDIFYQRKSATDRREYKPGTAQGTPMFFMPGPGVIPVLAARDGKIWSSGLTERGWTIVIDHGKPFATYYTHMARSEFPDIASGVIKGTQVSVPVKAGDLIGWIGGDPLEKTHLNHLHFSVAHDGIPERDAVDPAPSMKTWTRVAWEAKP